MIKTSVLALALMGGAAHAQSTPGQAVDINVSVGAQCSLTSKAAANLTDGSSALFEDDSFFQIECNKDLPYSMTFSGQGVDVSNGDVLMVTLVNQQGTEFAVSGSLKTPLYDFYVSSPGGYTATGTGQSQDWGLRFHTWGTQIREAEIGNYTANVTATVVY